MITYKETTNNDRQSIMEFCESTQASWVAMVMERLQTVEKDNQELRDELRNRTPTPIDESKLSHIQSTVVSTYIFCPVYLDRAEFRNIYKFAKSFMSSAMVFEAMFSWMFYDDVMRTRKPLKRPIMYLSAVCWDIGPHEAFEIISTVWKDVLVPSEVLSCDLYEDTHEPDKIVQMASYITDTTFYDVWSHLIGHARSAIHIRHDGCITKARDHLMNVQENEERQVFMAQFMSACAMDRIILHDPQSIERKQTLLNSTYLCF